VRRFTPSLVAVARPSWTLVGTATDPATIQAAGEALIDQISLLLEFAQLNSEALRKIIKKFDKKMGQTVSSGIKERLAATNLLSAPTELEPLKEGVAARLVSLQVYPHPL